MNISDELSQYQENLVQFIREKYCVPYKNNKKEVSRNDYAKLSGISKGTLSRIKEGYGYDLPLSTIYKFCKFENISVAELLDEFEKTLINK